MNWESNQSDDKGASLWDLVWRKERKERINSVRVYDCSDAIRMNCRCCVLWRIPSCLSYFVSFVDVVVVVGNSADTIHPDALEELK